MFNQKLVFSVLGFVLMVVSYVITHYWSEKNKKLGSVCKEITDAMPCILLAVYFNPICAFFLIGCEICNEFIHEDTPIGMGLYLIVYGGTGVYTVIKSFSNPIIPFNLSLIFSIIIAVGLIILCLVLNIKTKQPIAITVGEPIYIVLAIIPVLTGMFMTLSVGLLALVIGDTLLCIYFTTNNKTVHTVSESMFFFGEAFTPLTLIAV